MTAVMPGGGGTPNNRIMHALASAWTSLETVAGFSQSPPNEALLAFAAGERARGGRRALDIGCGAARNAAPLAEAGWDVLGLDLSSPMLDAARVRTSAARLRVQFALAAMDGVPVADSSMDLIVAHGIWNLARSGAEFRRGVWEAARVARRGAALFVFTFSRRTIPETAVALPGETFVFTQFSGAPQCFLTDAQLVHELGRVGFVPDPALPLNELNLPRPGVLTARQAPVIYQGAFRATR